MGSLSRRQCVSASGTRTVVRSATRSPSTCLCHEPIWRFRVLVKRLEDREGRNNLFDSNACSFFAQRVLMPVIHFFVRGMSAEACFATSEMNLQRYCARAKTRTWSRARWQPILDLVGLVWVGSESVAGDDVPQELDPGGEMVGLLPRAAEFGVAEGGKTARQLFSCSSAVLL